MLRQILGVKAVEKLYVELLFRCNFSCSYCYHGERLQWKDRFTLKDLARLVSIFQREYKLRAVTLLGGEPFVYKELKGAVRLIHEADLRVVVITNGYKIQRPLRVVAPFVDELRVSLDGLAEHHDGLRREGSFRAVLETLFFAKSLGLATSVTMTVNETNAGDIVPLSYLLSEYGVQKIDAHCLRPVGGGAQERFLSSVPSAGNDLYRTFEDEIAAKSNDFPVPIVFEDEEFHPACLATKRRRLVEEGVLDRFNLQANGEAYLSCTYTGTGLNSFFYNKADGSLCYLGAEGREIELLGLQEVKP